MDTASRKALHNLVYGATTFRSCDLLSATEAVFQIPAFCALAETWPWDQKNNMPSEQNFTKCNNSLTA